MTKKKYEFSERDQRIASSILTQFMFTSDFDDVMKVWHEIYVQFGLRTDPFTRTPCSPNDYAKYSLEYEKQSMLERYGYFDD